MGEAPEVVWKACVKSFRHNHTYIHTYAHTYPLQLDICCTECTLDDTAILFLALVRGAPFLYLKEEEETNKHTVEGHSNFFFMVTYSSS